MENQKHSNLRLFLRTLTPSLSSLAGSLALMVFVVGFHLLLLSNQSELFLPHVAGENNDQLALVYETNFLGPLNNLFGSSFLGVASTALIWGLTGWLVYALIDFIINSWQDWRRSDTDIAHPGKDQIVRHPMQEQTIIRILWRFLIGIVAVSMLLVLHQVVSNLFQHDVLLLRADNGIEMLKHLIILIVGWLSVFHVYVVLFRLFVFRTRVFGEIIN